MRPITEEQRDRAVAIGQRFRAARGLMSPADAIFHLRTRLGPRSSRRPDVSWIHKLEKGLIAEPDLRTVTLLARVYGSTLEELASEWASAASDSVVILTDECAPWESNPEPADFPESLALVA